MVLCAVHDGLEYVWTTLSNSVVYFFDAFVLSCLSYASVLLLPYRHPHEVKICCCPDCHGGRQSFISSISAVLILLIIWDIMPAFYFSDRVRYSNDNTNKRGDPYPQYTEKQDIFDYNWRRTSFIYKLYLYNYLFCTRSGEQAALDATRQLRSLWCTMCVQIWILVRLEWELNCIKPVEKAGHRISRNAQYLEKADTLDHWDRVHYRSEHVHSFYSVHWLLTWVLL